MAASDNNGLLCGYLYDAGGERFLSSLGNESTISNPKTVAAVELSLINAKRTQQETRLAGFLSIFGVPLSGIQSLGNGQASLSAAVANTRTVQSDMTEGRLQYYYHADHLGSTGYITGLDGTVLQHVEYIPGGEAFFEEKAGSWSTPYLFSSKELDDETGLYYFGARYYNSHLGIWMSTDPMELHYPGVSSYAYCAGNPVNVIDIGGAMLGDYYDKNGKWLGSDGKKDNYAFLANGVKIINGKKIFENAIKLDISNSVLNIYANTVAMESSGNKEESYAIASTIKNLSRYKKKNILSTLREEGIYGYKNGGNTTSYKKNFKYSMEAVINALTGGKDFSNGAIRWDGFDLAAKGFRHNKPSFAGIKISEQLFEEFKKAWPDHYIKKYSRNRYSSFSTNFHSGSHRATKGMNKNLILYNATSVKGRTIFWGINYQSNFHGTY